jgi:acetyl-CoA carboxylase biotin carboxyl carrier protein
MSDTVKAHLPGIFYRRPAPDKPAYVEEGDTVQAGDTVGLIEVMKNFSEVQSEQAGTIGKFLIENEDPVEVEQDIVELHS